MPALILLLPFVAALALLALPRIGRARAATLLSVATAGALVGLLLLAPAVFNGEVVRFSHHWLPQLGLAFTLRIDGYAWMFAAIVLVIGLLVVLYAAWYLADDDPPERFFAFLGLFMGAMLGVVLAGNLLLMLVFWELTSLSSFLLIGYWADQREARTGARMALALTGFGGLALLAGVLLIGHMAGSYELDAVLAAGDTIRAHPLYVPALVLVLLGAFTKSAQFPFHFWLPHAMAAPTPVSAYLHSATMVKAGVFLLGRLHPALAGSDEWFVIVTLTGAITLAMAAYLAIFQQDLKGLLAYSTISHLGLITLLFGVGTPLGVVAAVFHILNHAVFKASLFMAAGIIDHETGTRDFRKLGGLIKHMPITGALAIVASLAMAGVPLLNGFLSKEMFLAETLAIGGKHPLLAWLVPGLAVAASVFAVAYSLRFIDDVFIYGDCSGLDTVPHEPPRFMRVPVEILVVACLVVGIAPGLTIGPLLALGAGGALQAPLPEYKLAVWHGLNLPLAMSAFGLVGGVTLYFVLQRQRGLHRYDPPPIGKRAFDALLRALTGAARRITAALESGNLQQYLAIAIATAIALGAAPFLAGADWSPGHAERLPVNPLAGVLWLLLVASTLGVLMAIRQRVVALVILGLAGLSVSLVFVFLSAPDLALTQLLVEIVSIVLILLALRYLPQAGTAERFGLRQWRDSALALAAGGGVTALVYAVLTRPTTSISDYFLRTTVPEGGGANAVNVIIVDYRGFDTLGEIAVFGIASLVIYALLRSANLVALTNQPDGPPPPRSLMLTTIMGALLPLAAAVSLYLFLRGHNLPGGGFIGGLVLVIGLILQYVARGVREADTQVGVDWHLWVGWGLIIAVATGVGAFAFGHPFLTSSTPYVELPVVGKVPFASAMGFDTGVYLVVIGGAMLVLLTLARLSATRTAER